MEKRKNEKKKKRRNKSLYVSEADTSEEHILERRNSFWTIPKKKIDLDKKYDPSSNAFFNTKTRSLFESSF